MKDTLAQLFYLVFFFFPLMYGTSMHPEKHSYKACFLKMKKTEVLLISGHYILKTY